MTLSDLYKWWYIAWAKRWANYVLYVIIYMYTLIRCYIFSLIAVTDSMILSSKFMVKFFWIWQTNVKHIAQSYKVVPYLCHFCKIHQLIKFWSPLHYNCIANTMFRAARFGDVILLSILLSFVTYIDWFQLYNIFWYVNVLPTVIVC